MTEKNKNITNLLFLCLKVLRLTTFPTILGMLIALGYEFDPPFFSLLMSEKKLSFAKVDMLLTLYVPSLVKKYRIILIEIFCKMASNARTGIPLMYQLQYLLENLWKSMPLANNSCILNVLCTHLQIFLSCHRLQTNYEQCE